MLGVLTLLYLGLKGKDKKLMLSAGLVACALPLIHTHSLVFLGFFTAALIPLTWKYLAGRAKPRLRHLKFWLWFIGPILLVALPQFVWLTTGTGIAGSIRFQYGWTKGTDDLLWFWVKNTGVFIPLIIAGLLLYKKEFSLLVKMALAAGFVFLLANFFVFQPWDWDNTKLLSEWYVLSLPLVVLVLCRLADRGWFGTAGVFLLVLSLTLAGAADVSKAVQPQSYKVLLFDGTGQDIGRAVMDRSAPDSVWLTSQQMNNPVTVLGGRRTLLGYSGNLWSYGLDFSERETDVKTLFEAQSDVTELLRKYGVDYVVIGSAERTDKGFTVNEEYYRNRFPLWERFGSPETENGPVNVYDVRSATR